MVKFERVTIHTVDTNDVVAFVYNDKQRLGPVDYIDSSHITIYDTLSNPPGYKQFFLDKISNLERFNKQQSSIGSNLSKQSPSSELSFDSYIIHTMV